MRNVKFFYQLLGCLLASQLLYSVQLSAQNGYVQASNKINTNGNRQYQAGRTEDTNDKQTLIHVLKDLNKKKGVYFLF